MLSFPQFFEALMLIIQLCLIITFSVGLVYLVASLGFVAVSKLLKSLYRLKVGGRK